MITEIETHESAEIIAQVIDNITASKSAKEIFENITNKSSLLRLLTSVALVPNAGAMFSKAQKVTDLEINYNISQWDFDDKHKEHLVWGKFLVIELEAENLALAGEDGREGQIYFSFKLADHSNYLTIIPLEQFKNNRLWLTFKWLIRDGQNKIINEKWEGKNYHLRKLTPAKTIAWLLDDEADTELPLISFPKAEIAEKEADLFLTNIRSSYVNLPLNDQKLFSRYNALLAANLPTFPDDKTIGVKNLQENISYHGKTFELSTETCQNFIRYPLPTWNYNIGEQAFLQKKVYLHPEKNTVCISYRWNGQDTLTLQVKPLLEWRNFHQQTKAYVVEKAWNKAITPLKKDFCGFVFTPEEKGKLYGYTNSESCRYEQKIEWQYNLLFPQDKERGTDDQGDAFYAGIFSVELNSTQPEVTFCFSTDELVNFDFEKLAATEYQRLKNIIDTLPVHLQKDRQAKILTLALDQFITKRDGFYSLIAGYPWFREWGRDSMVVVRGLLTTRRFAEARDILTQFARLSDSGTFPNAINGQNTGDRDTVDAPLLFILAIKEYINASKDTEFLYQQIPDGRFILLVMEEIFESLIQGAPNGVYMDKKTGLIWAPAHYTWMDTSFPAATPREGYPVEIQAFWYSSLKYLEEIYEELGLPKKSKKCAVLAQKVHYSFDELFWLADGYLADVIRCGAGISAMIGTADKALRPNQLFAVAYGLLDQARALSIIRKVNKNLLIPAFLRSRSEDQAQEMAIPFFEGNKVKSFNYMPYKYYGTYVGDENTERKPAYHNGTGWLWLMGSYIDSYLYANNYSQLAVQRALEILEPVFEHLRESTIGTLSEICDGSYPHTPRGCSAQAWSVSEILRAYSSIKHFLKTDFHHL